MKEKLLYAIWAAMYILCVGLGTIDNAQGFGRVLLMLVALLFFVPGGLLVYSGLRSGNKKRLLAVRLISLISLGLTLGLLVANFMSATGSAQLGRLLYDLLGLVSAPMLCSQYWVLSLFLWACLLMATLQKPKPAQP